MIVSVFYQVDGLLVQYYIYLPVLQTHCLTVARNPEVACELMMMIGTICLKSIWIVKKEEPEIVSMDAVGPILVSKGQVWQRPFKIRTPFLFIFFRGNPYLHPHANTHSSHVRET